MLEADIESKMRDWAKGQGGKSFKLKDEAERGWPDQTMFLPNMQILIPEVKRPKLNKRYEQQKRRVAFLQEMGFASDFVESVEELEALHRKYYGG